MINKNDFVAKMHLLANLTQQCEELTKDIKDDYEDVLGTKLINALLLSLSSNSDLSKKELNGYDAFANLPKGKRKTMPKLSITHGGNMLTLSLPTNGGTLEATAATSYIAESDQVSLVYKTPDGDLIDLVFAEVKTGELAKVHGLPKNNKQVDMLVWSDPHTENYTHRFEIPYSDLVSEE